MSLCPGLLPRARVRVETWCLTHQESLETKGKQHLLAEQEDQHFLPAEPRRSQNKGFRTRLHRGPLCPGTAIRSIWTNSISPQKESPTSPVPMK